MRYFLTVLFLMTIGLQASAREDFPPSRVDIGQIIQDDRFVPFPYSVQLPLPTGAFEGTWLAQTGDFSSYFAFRLLDTVERSYQIRQVDTLTCREVAYGLGVLSRTSKTFVAEMRYLKFERRYRMLIRAFDYSKSRSRDKVGITPINGSVVVLSLMPEGRENYVHMPFSKIYDFYTPAPCRQRK